MSIVLLSFLSFSYGKNTLRMLCMAMRLLSYLLSYALGIAILCLEYRYPKASVSLS